MGMGKSKKTYSLSDLDLRKGAALIDEASTSIELLVTGLEKLKKAHYASILHLSILLLSLGYERILKSLLLLNYLNENGDFPNKDVKLWKMGKHGHNIFELHKKLVNLPVLNEYAKKCPLCAEEVKFIKKNELFLNILKVLTNFGVDGRYYNLNYLLGNEKDYENYPIKQWHEIEREIFISSLDNSNSDDLKAIENAERNVVEKIEETIKISIGVFARMMLNNCFGDIGKRLVMIGRYHNWTKPLAENLVKRDSIK